MRILVTGGAGFVGSHVVDILLNDGHSVTVVDDLSTGLRENVSPGARLVVEDIRSDLDDVFREARPEVVIHLAAQVSVPTAVQAPLHDLSVNIAGTVNVLEASARVNARKIIAVSSAAVYGVPEDLPLTEDTPTNPISPYGLSKLAGEAYIRMLGPLRGLTYTILRPSNIFGPRQLADGEGAVVPSFLQRFLRSEDPVIHGDGAQTRDFIYVTDMAHAIVRALDRADGLTLNASTGQAVSIMDLWLLLSRMVDWSRPPVFAPARPGDIPHSVMANDAARSHLDWNPEVSLSEGLQQTVMWWKKR